MNFLCIFKHKAALSKQEKTGILILRCQRCHCYLSVNRLAFPCNWDDQTLVDYLRRKLPLYIEDLKQNDRSVK